MAVTLKRDSSGLCRCPDGSLVICADCDCSFAGLMAFMVDGVGPYQVPYNPDMVSDWKTDWPFLTGAGAPPWPSVPSFGGDSWALKINIDRAGTCLWRYSVTIMVYSGGSMVAAGVYMSGGGIGSHCWSGVQVLAHMAELGFGDGWPSALDSSGAAWPA